MKLRHTPARRMPRPLDQAVRLALLGATVGAMALPGLALAKKATKPADPAASAPAKPRVQRAEPTITLNFVNAEIDAVARAIGASLGKVVVVDPRVKGQMTLYSEKPLPLREAMASFQVALRGLGFAITESDGLMKIVNEGEAKLQGGAVMNTPDLIRGDQIGTQVFRLQHESAANALTILRTLISPNNAINMSPGNNSLVITDYADNLRRLAKIIAAIDVPSATDPEIIPIKHGVAADIATLVQRLNDGAAAAPGQQGVPSGSGVQVLADGRSNTVIVRAPSAAKLESVKAMIQQLDKPVSGQAASGNIWVVYLKNADATKLANTLRAAFGSEARQGNSGGSSGAAAAVTAPATGGTATSGGIGAPSTAGFGSGGSSASANTTGGFIQADPSTNSLIITAPEPLYRQVRNVIDMLDTRRAQVYVESMIVEMSAQQAAEYGFQWQGLLNSSSSKNIVLGGTNFGTNGQNIVNLSLAGASATPSVSLPQGANIGVVRKFAGAYTLASLAHFLESNTDANILSTPNLIALDNEESEINIGQEIGVVTGQYTNNGTGGGGSGSVNPFQTVDRKQIGLKLKVKPQIGEGGTVRLIVSQENSSVVSNTTGQTASAVTGPTLNKSTINTTVVVDDGAIMVLGGLLKDDTSAGRDEVPGLARIPLIGNLFKSENRTRRKTNLMLFLRPVIIRDGEVMQQFSIDRYEAIRALQNKAQGPGSLMLPGSGDSAVLPALKPAQRLGESFELPAQPAPAPAPAPKGKASADGKQPKP